MMATEIEEPDLKKTTYGIGLLKGLGITWRHLFSKTVTIQYPDEKDPLPPRSRGVIALKTENCTVCMLCARECPDWCIYIEGHKESRQPVVEGKRAKKYNVLDRFAIDYALCMYCGICVDVCPYDALFWSPEYEYAEHDVTSLTHEMDRLNDWMATVLAPLPLDEGAQGPEWKSLAQTGEAMAAPTVPQASAPPATAPAAPEATQPPSPAPSSEEAPAPGPAPESDQTPPPSTPPAAGSSMSVEEAAEVRKRILEEELAKGSDPRVAEARAKAAEMRARKGTSL